MARKEHKDNSKLRELMQEYGVKTMQDVQNFVKMLTAETVQTALDVELESELGYSKYDYKNKQTDNSRNGIVTKKAAYVAIGTDLEGKKDVLGTWLGASESAKYWLIHPYFPIILPIKLFCRFWDIFSVFCIFVFRIKA